ncbi:MAG: sporulation protein YqfD, partial [Clostridiales bacterium]
YLRELSRLSHCRFRICRRYGLPFLLRFIRHRPMLPVAGFCCLFLLIWLSSLVWGIEIVGPYPISPERQQRLLFLSEQAGVSLYASRWGMDLEAAENYLLREEKALVFAEIEPHGSRLVVSAVYRVDVTEPDQQKEPGDVVAVADGVIRQILVQQGRALVKPGTAVRQGEVLISGQVGKLQMAAAGLITADIWAEGYGECPRTI